jgi:hypothetical protein
MYIRGIRQNFRLCFRPYSEEAWRALLQLSINCIVFILLGHLSHSGDSWHAKQTEEWDVRIICQSTPTLFVKHEDEQHIEVNDALGPEACDVAVLLCIRHEANSLAHPGNHSQWD